MPRKKPNPSQTAPNKKEHFHGLQILRGLAALTVVFYHTGHMVNKEIGQSVIGGFLGWDRWGIAAVLLFFSISGFVISHAADHKNNPLTFLFDRILRIYPGYFCAVLLTVLLKLITYNSFPWGSYSWESLTLLPLGLNDYVLGVEWSLTYEIAFYIIVSICLAIAPTKRLTIFAALWILIIITANMFFIENWETTRLNPNFIELLFSGFCIPFCLGIICHRLRHFLRFLKWPSILGAGAFYGVYALSTSTLVSLLSLTLGGCTLIMVMVNFSKLKETQQPTPLLWLGDRSYGIYLFHSPLITTITLAILKPINPNPTTSAISLALIVIAGATAYASLEYFTYKNLRSHIKRITMNR